MSTQKSVRRAAKKTAEPKRSKLQRIAKPLAPIRPVTPQKPDAIPAEDPPEVAPSTETETADEMEPRPMTPE